MADTPESVGDGGSLVYTGGDYIYALGGYTSKNFWRYSISSDSWTKMSDTPAQVGCGGSLVYTGDYIYALRGDTTKDFWRYAVGGDTGYDKLASQGLMLRGNIATEGKDFGIIGGKVGIGTTSPTEKLHIKGNVKIEGNLNVTGNISGNISLVRVIEAAPFSGTTPSDICKNHGYDHCLFAEEVRIIKAYPFSTDGTCSGTYVHMADPYLTICNEPLDAGSTDCIDYPGDRSDEKMEWYSVVILCYN